MRPFCREEQVHCLGQGKGTPKPPLRNDVQKKLQDYFHPLNENFFKLLNQTFDW